MELFVTPVVASRKCGGEKSCKHVQIDAAAPPHRLSPTPPWPGFALSPPNVGNNSEFMILDEQKLRCRNSANHPGAVS